MKEVYVRRAIESAINAMPGMNPITSYSAATSTVITTPKAHGLTSGMAITINGAPAIDGNYIVTVTGALTFTIPKNVAAAGTGGAYTLTAWENIPFTPPASTVPFQVVWFPEFMIENPTMGSNFHRIRSYIQIDLMYPLLAGTAAIETRAGLIQSTFDRGSSFTNGGITVRIESTPSISGGIVDGDRYKKIIKIRYWADVFA